MDSSSVIAASADNRSVSEVNLIGFAQGAPRTIAPSSITSSSSPDLARVFVRLPNGTKFLVPVPQDANVHELHIQALRRAGKIGVNGTPEDTLLETIGNDPIVLFSDDLLLDVMDLTADNTFGLRPLVNPSSSSLESQGGGTSANLSASNISFTAPNTGHSPHGEDSVVYIRWITLEAALDNSCLRQLPVDGSPIPSGTTLNDLYMIAVDRLCGSSPQGTCTNPTRLNLFLRECSLHALNNPATLSDLGLKGNRRGPLNIFIEFVGPERRLSLNHLSSSNDPKSLWNFDSTIRGMSTFITSLQILLKEIERGNCSLDGIIEVLWELTHFPPLLLAFRAVHESRLGSEAPVGPLLLVASAFHAICRRMVPSEICPSSENLLEASRQITYWICSMRSEASLLRSSAQKLIRQAQIEEAADNRSLTPTFLPFNEVTLPLAPGTGPREKTFLVSCEIKDSALCRLLGLAIHENAARPWDFYFHSVGGWKDLWNHKIVALLQPKEFGTLIDTTNSDQAFRMIGPLQIGTCLAAELPVITLSATGYVSRYDHEDMECAERAFITWNAIEKRTKLPGNPGQFLSQKLDPILLQRKGTLSWALDAWTEWTKAADFGAPEEAIIICVDTSSSMASAMPYGWLLNQNALGSNPSRLTEVKEFFKNQALRISALNLSTYLGLVTFAGSVVTNQPLTPLHLNFSHQLDGIQAAGNTAIFDALDRASGMLVELQHRYPQTKCRIILLTDGCDNNSKAVPFEISSRLYERNIVLDAIVIGSSETRELFKIAKNTGGYAFKPLTQQALFQIFLLETVSDIRTRPDIVRVKCNGSLDWSIFVPKAADMSDPYNFPPCRPHPNQEDYFIALADAGQFMSRMSRRPGGSAGSVYSVSTTLSNASTLTATAGGISRILLSEIKAMVDNPHKYMDIYVSQSNMGFWKVVMQGPPDSPYARGTFLLYVEIGPEFPRKPPSARFITPMLHPNITKHGRVCHPVFDREWSPATRVYAVLQQLYGILMSFEARDAVDPLSALRFLSDEAGGRREVVNYVSIKLHFDLAMCSFFAHIELFNPILTLDQKVSRFAQRPRHLHRADIIGDDLSSVGWSSTKTPSSYASSVVSDTTIVSASLNPFGAHAQNLGRNPSTNPPSYRTAPSLSQYSIRSVSTLSSDLASQRRPTPQPPTAAGNQASGNANGGPQAGNGGRGRVPSGSVVSSSASVVSGSSDNGSEAGTVSSRRSRRASFFAKLRNVGSNV
ncbi:Uncharacterized protein BP5553_03140 [Venustampulla echinocandica]|uniref:UBC core domain-containing protein n=1 Tax=Venustampulla echinocandica TaxID=2656787 RepID=A0A370TTF0_9HELO|nr:Uncharacterized protein BP5553_03140 [Venustampulla echinocandica]RDL38800.1 Uncharacterized protein BP5553_03140 [Venustampulla echinocandica]